MKTLLYGIHLHLTSKIKYLYNIYLLNITSDSDRSLGNFKQHVFSYKINITFDKSNKQVIYDRPIDNVTSITSWSGNVNMGARNDKSYGICLLQNAACNDFPVPGNHYLVIWCHEKKKRKEFLICSYLSFHLCNHWHILFEICRMYAFLSFIFQSMCRTFNKMECKTYYITHRKSCLLWNCIFGKNKLLLGTMFYTY